MAKLSSQQQSLTNRSPISSLSPSMGKKRNHNRLLRSASTIAILLLLAAPLVLILAQDLNTSADSEQQNQPDTENSETTQAIPSTSENLETPQTLETPDANSPGSPILDPDLLQDQEPAAASAANGPAQWYRSNQLGMALELLQTAKTGQQARLNSTLPPSLTDSDSPWVLATQRNTQQEIKTLFFRGQPQENWLTTYRGEKLFQQQHKRGTVLIENRFYDEESGRLSEISHYDEATQELSDRLLLFYDEDGRLYRSMFYDENGQLVRESTYRLNGAGQLVKLNIQMHLKGRSLVQYLMPSIDTFSQNSKNSNKYLVSLFDGNRRNTRQVLYQDNAVTKRTSFEYGPDGKLRKTIVTGKEQVTQYDYNTEGNIQGLLLQKQVWQNSALSQTEVRAYDSFGRLKNKKTSLWAKNEFREERYSYTGSSSDLKKIEYFINDTTDKIRNYTGLYHYYEELYFNNAPVAKVYYSYDDQLETEITAQNAPVPENFDEGFPSTTNAVSPESASNAGN